MEPCEYAPYANTYGACRGPVAPRDAIHVPDKPPVPCARLCEKHAVNLRTGFHGDLDTRELLCERRGQGACQGRVEYRDEIQTEEDCFPIAPLCDRHWGDRSTSTWRTQLLRPGSGRLGFITTLRGCTGFD